MEIKINGDLHTDVIEQSALSDILLKFEIRPETPGIAIAVNEKVISRSRWKEYALQPGDQIEIIRAFQGG